MDTVAVPTQPLAVHQGFQLPMRNVSAVQVQLVLVGLEPDGPFTALSPVY
jgi:hypothetical protein